MDAGSRIIVRPSGTEPKLKCYYEVVAAIAPTDEYSVIQTKANEAMVHLIEEHQKSLI
jgi:phosphomannomutase